MTRLIATLKLDALNQHRQGFYFASLFLVMVMACLVTVIPDAASFVLPAILLTNMVISTFVLLGVMLLFERGERTLEGQIVTPLRIDEYLASKIITLAALATLENAAITGAALADGLVRDVNWAWILIGSLQSGVLYTLLGLLTVIRCKSINDFLMPMILITAVLELPAMVCLGMPEYGWLYVLPTHGPLLMFQSALEPKPAGLMIYALIYPSLWLFVSYRFGRRAVRGFVTGEIGKV